MRVVVKPLGMVALGVLVLAGVAVPVVLRSGGSARGGLVNSEKFEFYTEMSAQAFMTPFKANEVPGGSAYRFTTTVPGPKPWNVGFHQAIKSGLKDGEKLRLSFWARSPESAAVTPLLQLSRAPYTRHWKTDIPLTPVWKEYNVDVECTEFAPNDGMISILVGQSAGIVELGAISLQRAK